MQDENWTHARDSAMPKSQQMECYHSLNRIWTPLSWINLQQIFRQNSTGIIFAPQIVQNREKKGDSNMTLNQVSQVQKSSPTWITEPEVLLQSPFTFLHKQIYAKTQNKFKLGYLLLKTCLLQNHSQNTMASKKDRRNKSFCNINKNLLEIEGVLFSHHWWWCYFYF